jgi:hypothetical protein
MSRTSLALNNLRAVVIVIVLAFHSVLAYLASLPALAVATGGLSLGAFFTQARPGAAFSFGQKQPAMVKRDDPA